MTVKDQEWAELKILRGISMLFCPAFYPFCPEKYNNSAYFLHSDQL